MSNPNNSVDLNERRKLVELLDRLDDVDRARAPKLFLPELITGQWLHGDADARRKIEEAIGRLPKKSN